MYCFVCLFLVVSTGAINCMKDWSSTDITCYVLSETLMLMLPSAIPNSCC